MYTPTTIDYQDLPTSLADVDGSTVVCTAMEECPADFTAGTTISVELGGGCSWTRKLAAFCVMNGDDVTIRVMSNGLPNHCFLTTDSPQELEIDFTTMFNQQGERSDYLNAEYTQSGLDSYLCNPGSLTNDYDINPTDNELSLT